jgi:hypothetical protein
MSNTDPFIKNQNGDTSALRRMALVALLLMLLGVTILTVGIMLAFGVPIGLVALGAITLGGGILLGITS